VPHVGLFRCFRVRPCDYCLDGTIGGDGGGMSSLVPSTSLSLLLFPNTCEDIVS